MSFFATATFWKALAALKIEVKSHCQHNVNLVKTLNNLALVKT